MEERNVAGIATDGWVYGYTADLCQAFGSEAGCLHSPSLDIPFQSNCNLQSFKVYSN